MKTIQLVCIGLLYLFYVITMVVFGFSAKKKNPEERNKLQYPLIVITSYFQILLLFYIAIKLAVAL